MYSSEGEKVELSNTISTSAARGAVEKWLLQVQDTMIVSVRDVTAKARDVRWLVHVWREFRKDFLVCRHMLWTPV